MIDWFITPPMTREEIDNEIKYLLENDKEIKKIYEATKIPIVIDNCLQGSRAMYDIKKKQIVISPINVYPGTIRESLLHECIHSYDHLVRKIDLSKSVGLARSEVHAAKLCECRGSWFKKSCTYNKAVRAVSISIGDTVEANRLVSDVFDDAFYENIFFSHDLDP